MGQNKKDHLVYTRESRESSLTGWIVGIIVALVLLAIGYVVVLATPQSPTTTTSMVQELPAPVSVG